jgi:arylformamidase
MRIIDISWPIAPDTTEYNNESQVLFSAIRSLDNDEMRKSRISLSSHTATHVDAPAHFIAEGKTIDQIPLTSLVGSAAVIDMTGVQDVITQDDLEPFVLPKGVILLLKTRNSTFPEYGTFMSQFVYLDESAAAYCAELGVKAVGIDYLSIERNQPAHETHTTLFQKEISIIEGLRLAHVMEGYYFFVCLPLAVVGLEAAPARAILIDDLL